LPFVFHTSDHHRNLHSFPTRRSSDLGKEIGVSEWLAVTQERINQFAEATEDRQWIHVDPERATRESPYHATIAHGFLTLSLISRSEEHTSELQSRSDLVCRLLLEKKN